MLIKNLENLGFTKLEANILKFIFIDRMVASAIHKLSGVTAKQQDNFKRSRELRDRLNLRPNASTSEITLKIMELNRGDN